MGPAPHQTPRLIVQMRQLHLQPPLRTRRPLAENLEDEPGAINHLRLGRGFQIALLDRGQRTVDDQQFGVMRAQPAGNALHLSAAEQCRWLRTANVQCNRVDHINPDRPGQPRRLGQARIHIARAACSAVGVHNDGARAPADAVFALKIKAGLHRHVSGVVVA